MSRHIITSLEQLRAVPVGTTLSMGLTGELTDSPLGCVVKVNTALYATPSGTEGRVWSYYHEDELSGTIQGDPEAAWWPLEVDEIPTTEES